MAIPNRVPARISPDSIAGTVTGVERSLSRVFILVSQGAIMGATDEEVKKTATAIIAGMSSAPLTFLPRVKARKRKNGKTRPKMRTGAFK